jgi:hypothetical protein
MELPAGFPSTLIAIAKSGYVTRSGNRASLELAVKNGEAHGAVVIWERDPSDADKHEFEQIVESGGDRVTRGPDLEDTREAASQMREFLGYPKLK